MDNITISWSKEVPKIIRNFRDGMITLFAGLIPFQDTLAEWIGITTNQFTTICGIGILVTGVISKMFGVSDGTTVSQTSYGVGGGTVGTPKPPPPPPLPPPSGN